MTVLKFNDCEVAGGTKLFQVTLDGRDYVGSAHDETEALRQARLIHPQDVRSLIVTEIDSSAIQENESKQSEADLIREALVADPSLNNKQVIEQLASNGVKVTSSQVTAAREALKAE